MIIAMSLGAMVLLMLVASRYGFIAGGLTSAFAILTQIILTIASLKQTGKVN